MASCWKGTAVPEQLELFAEHWAKSEGPELICLGFAYWDELLASNSLELLIGPETGHTEHAEH